MSDSDAESVRSSSSTEDEEEESVAEAVEETSGADAEAVEVEDIDEEENEPPSPVTKTPSKQTPAKSNNRKSPSKSTPASPKVSYIKLVEDAIVKLKDRTGSSKVAIEKYILANHPEVHPDKLKSRLLLTLKQGVANKRLIKVKASFKINPAAKKVAKKAAKKKKTPQKKEQPKEKKLTKAELAEIKEKERLAAKEKERLDRIRKRKFPMDDLELITEDKELKVNVSLPSRPSLPLVLTEFPSSNKSDSMGTGLLDDIFHVYHFFRGDIGWGRFPAQKTVVAPFTLQQWIQCVQQVLRGTAKKSRMLPPLMTHLFVVALQHLVPKELQAALAPASWSEVLMLYMDAMERYYTTEASETKNALSGLAIDTEYLVGRADEPKDESELEPPTQRLSAFYLQGSLEKVHAKLFANDPWMLTAEELLLLLKTLVDDMMAALPECSEAFDARLLEVHELLKQKRDADAAFRKVQNVRKKEQNEEKQKQESGEKATRSNTKLPSVSDAQIETARRNQQRANDAYDKALRSLPCRTEPIGEDRHFHTLFHFYNDPEKVYVLQRGKAIPSSVSYKLPGLENYRTNWHCIDKRSSLEKYVESLDVRGNRESRLREALSPALKTVEDDIKAMNDQKARLKDLKDAQRKLENAKLKCEFGRKSGRLAAQSEKELTDLMFEIECMEKEIAGQGLPVKVNLEKETGLEMLREFDNTDEVHNRKRTTRREAQRQQEEEEESKHTKFPCSRLWSTGNIDGTGLVGSFVLNLLELEERAERLATWEKIDRKKWISNLETAVHSWNTSNPPQLEDQSEASNGASSPQDGGSAKKQRRNSDPAAEGSTVQSISQIINSLKNPILDLEARIFELSGLAVAAQDADEADDNMSTSPDDDKKEEEQAVWKKLISRLNRLPAKAHSKIRQLVVEAIGAARKAHQPLVVQQLRDALLQFHPEAAGSCKMAALDVLEKHGGYDDADDEEEEEEEPDAAEEEAQEEEETTENSGISAVLCAEAVILNSCLDGKEDASRNDWISAVKKAKTIAKIASLATAFCSKAATKVNKMESESRALQNAMESWEKLSAQRKKKNQENVNFSGPSEVWAAVRFTDEFCLTRVEQYPLWPAKECIPKDQTIADALEASGHSLVSLVGESGGIRLVKTEELLPFSDKLPEDEDLSGHPKEIRAQLDDCMTMARRILRGKAKRRLSSAKKKNKKAPSSDRDFKEEKKLAT